MNRGTAECLCMVLYRENVPEELFLFPRRKKSLLGSIYLGQVEKVSENIGAAFVRISGDQRVYLPLSDSSFALYKTRKKNTVLRPGDELLVQIEKEAMKSKLPRAAARLRLPGKYLVLTAEGPFLNFSRRLAPEEKKRLRKIFERESSPFGIIARTNAGEAPEEELQKELREMKVSMEHILTQGICRPWGTCLYQSAPDWIQEFSRIPLRSLDRIVTDDPEVMEELDRCLAALERTPLSVELYRDSLLPLYRLYSLEALTDSLLCEKVWMKSGGFLVIQQTEAFAAIDVNTGKYDGKKNAEDTVFLINQEAAAEAARQIRLRQLSGVILIDFINMKREELRRSLLSQMKQLTAEDPVKTAVIDLTPLDIMEITRQKERRSLKEQLALLSAGEREEDSHGTDSI